MIRSLVVNVRVAVTPTPAELLVGVRLTIAGAVVSGVVDAPVVNPKLTGVIVFDDVSRRPLTRMEYAVEVERFPDGTNVSVVRSVDSVTLPTAAGVN